MNRKSTPRKRAVAIMSEAKPTPTLAETDPQGVVSVRAVFVHVEGDAKTIASLAPAIAALVASR